MYIYLYYVNFDIKNELKMSKIVEKTCNHIKNI